jgi:hypothetical protein
MERKISSVKGPGIFIYCLLLKWTIWKENCMVFGANCLVKNKVVEKKYLYLSREVYKTKVYTLESPVQNV